MPAEKSDHTLVITGLSDEIRVLYFEGTEGMSQLFELNVVIGTKSTLAFDDLVRKKATLTIGQRFTEDEACTRSGIVSCVEQSNPTAGWSAYTVTIVPWAWMLQHRVDSRIFQNMTVPAIVQSVLEGAGGASGTDFSLKLTATYSAREYCVQYRESDWDFVNRLLEEEGIFYYFEPDSGGDMLMIADSTSSYADIPGNATLVFRRPVGALNEAAAESGIQRFQWSEQIRSGKTTLRDWDFLKPSLTLEAQKTGSADTSLEIYDYPGEYTLKADGDALAAARLDEQTAARCAASAESDCSRVVAGHTFTLSEHPRDSFNAKYLITGLRYWGKNDLLGSDHDDGDAAGAPDGPQSHFGSELRLVLATILNRPPRVTRRPQIHGVQTAIVVGASGDEICTDANGRVKVQFHWDRLGQNDDKSSCWIRVAQFWASSAFGAIFLPRVKDEVVVAFMEGDPDRPLVVGSVYHGTNVTPYALPGEKTKSTIKTRSTPKGGDDAFNELRFEDKKGSEEVFLQAQKDWTINVKNDKNQTVGHDETLEVDHDRTKTVKNDQTATVQHDDTLTVQHDRSVTVQNDHTEAVTGNQSITIGKAQTVAISDKQEITVTKTRALTVSGDVTETYKAKLTATITGDVSETLQAKRTISVSGDHTESIGGKLALTITGDSTETVSGKKSMTVTGQVTITSGSSTVTIKPSGEITVSGVQITIDASGPLKLHGATVDVKSDGPMTLAAPVINGNADASHTIKGSAVTIDGQMVSIG